jgi:dihydrofolate reductase
MAKVIVINWVTLDGVMQAPGRPDEDTRDGFSHGGWAAEYSDELAGAKMGERMGGHAAWLFGRRSYDDLLSSWNAQGGPFKDALNDRPKYVASHDSSAKLDWPHSTLLSGDVPGAVAELKRTLDAPLVIMGSGVLIASLMAAGIIDEYLLMIAPIVLGEGRRLFAGPARVPLRLLDCATSRTGAIIASYEAVR